MKHRHVSKTFFRMTTLALVLAAGAAAGCNGRDSVTEAIQKADLNLSKLSMGGSAAAPGVASRKKIYTDIISGLKSVPDSASSSEVASASILTARGHAGLGEIAAQESARQESAFLGQVINTRTMLDQWISQNSVAAALDTFDPTKDLADLDTQIAENQKEGQELSAEKKTRQKVVDDLNAKAQDAEGKAKAIRDTEAQTRARAQSVSPSSRAELIQKAAEQRRAADELEKQASLFRAEVDKETPSVVELQTRYDNQLAKQKLLRQAKVDIQARADAGKATAAKARGEAANAGKEVETMIDKLAAQRQAIDGPTDESVKGYKAAITAAKKAAQSGQDAKTMGTLSAAGFEESLGDVLGTKARSLDAYSTLLTMIVNAQPALPSHDAMAAKAKAVGDQFTSVNEEAHQAYKDAIALFEKAGGGPEITPRVDRIVAALKALDKVVEVPVPETKPTETPASGSEAKPSEGAAPAEPTTTEPTDTPKKEPEPETKPSTDAPDKAPKPEDKP